MPNKVLCDCSYDNPYSKISIYGRPPPQITEMEPPAGGISDEAKKFQERWMSAAEHVELRQKYSLLMDKYNYLSDKYVELMMAVREDK